MRKHLLATLLLAFGLPFVGSFAAYADPEPQRQSQNTVTITGTVFDENNDPIIGASVVQKSVPANAAVTDFDGNFTLRVKPGEILRVSFVGYGSVEVAAQQSMTVYLQPTSEVLNELVAIGYGSQKKANLTGAVATVDVARTMDSRPYQDITNALQGAVPGLTITFGTGDLNASSNVRIRGIGTLSNSAMGSPLYVVDGVEMSDISYLNPQDIESISVLKDAASSAIYGTRAAFGVILIKTKGAKKGEKVSVRYTNNFGWSQATMLPEYGTVPDQLRAAIYGAQRANISTKVFGVDIVNLLPYAEAWQQQYGGKLGHVEMRPYVDANNVGDYRVIDGVAYYYANWDINGILFNNAAPSMNHNVTLNGTSGNTNYYLTFGYDGKEGLIKYHPEKRTRYNVSANINTMVTSFLEAGARINWTRTNFYKANTYSSNPLRNVYRWGSFAAPLGTIDGYNFRTISDYEDARTRKNVADLLQMTAYLKANITKDITLNGDFTYWTRNINEKGGDGFVYGINEWDNQITPSYIYDPANVSYTERLNEKYDTWNFNIYANYDKTWNDVHNFGAMLGVNVQNEQYEKFGVSRSYLQDLSTPMLNLATGTPSVNNRVAAYEKAYAGYFGRLTYNFRDTYLIEFNGRYDGSSSFPGGNKWAFFPSVSAGYRISQEKFWEPLTKAWSNAKIRASYGEVGNENINNYSYYSTIAAATSYWVTGQDGDKLSANAMPSFVNQDLSWERIQTTDVGLDLGFLNNSINVTFDWYQRTNANMLAPSNNPPTALGTGSPVANVGSLRTRGWELSIGWNHTFGDWMVYANAGVSDAYTEITKWSDESNLINSNYTGKRVGEIWGFETDRYFTEADFAGKDANGKWIYAPGVADQTFIAGGGEFEFGPGDIKYKDLDNSGTIDGGDGTIDKPGDLKVIGNTLPRYEYSFRVGGAWKGFDLDIFFQGIGKRDLWAVSAMNIPLVRTADLAVFKNQESYNVYDPANGVINISEDNAYPCMFAGNDGNGAIAGLWAGCNNFYPQSKYLINMAYLRLKNITFGYTLPAHITKKAYIQNARIYFSCNNPCLLYRGSKVPFDPELGVGQGQTLTTDVTTSGNGIYVGRAIPVNRTFSFGVQVTF